MRLLNFYFIFLFPFIILKGANENPPLLLDKYEIIKELGSGVEGIVYEIVDANNNQFAFKVYKERRRERQHGDLLALTKTVHSREFLKIPLIVNMEFGYSIFPLLSYKHTKPKSKDLKEFQQKINTALAKDNLKIGDHLNNYMYDKIGRLWRIDFGSLKEIKKRKKKKHHQ